MLLACRAMRDFLCGPTSPSTQSCNSGPRLQAFDLFTSEKPATRSPPGMNSDSAASLNDLRNAARELRLPSIDQSVAQIQDPTDPGGHEILAISNFRTLSSTDLRETHSLIDSLDREVQSGLPRHDIYVNCNLCLAPSPAETTREESAAPFEYSMMIPPYNRPETTIDLLAMFATSQNTETTDIHEFEINHALSPTVSQPGLKRPVMNDLNNDNLLGDPIDHLTRGPVDKKSRKDDTWSKPCQKPFIQHQLDPPTNLIKSNRKKMDVFQKNRVTVSGMSPLNDPKSRKENPHRIALVNHYDNKLKNKFLSPKMKSLDFYLDTNVVEDPSQKMKEALRMAFESINLNHGNKIILTFQDAAIIFARFQRNEYGPMAGENTFPKSLAQNLVSKRLFELSQNQDQWFEFWEGSSGINLEEELKGLKVDSNSNEKKLLLYFLFYVDMIDTIIPPSKSTTSPKNHKQNLFKDALKQFKDFKDSNQIYRSIDIDNTKSFNNNSPTLVWSCIYHWLSNGQRSDLESLSLSTGGKKNKGFKIFFNLIFKSNAQGFNNQLRPAPKFT
ncbi:hypothetical protein MJO29_010393 [Puccinia striiformis f. sp. tritici]|nr:hypothetical protein MJO29_010393 [Puccinia striiformis f. sp. tritici]